MQACRLETCFVCAREHGRIYIRGNERERDTRTRTRYFQIPEHSERVRLLAGSAPSGPNAGVAPFSLRAQRDFRKHPSAQDVEHAPVSEKSGNGDVATFVNNTPLHWMGLEAHAVGGEARKAQGGDAPLEPFANLTAHRA